MIKPIDESMLLKFLQGRRYLYPFAGVLSLTLTISAFPFVAIWEMRSELKEALMQGIALTICKVK